MILHTLKIFGLYWHIKASVGFHYVPWTTEAFFMLVGAFNIFIMARPTKTGLDYFPFDVNTDDKLELIEAEHGLAGFAIIVKLWQKIYSNGYYTEWSDDIALLFARRINSEKTLIISVINTCFLRGLLDKTLFDKYGILTSTGIQKRFFSVCRQSKRTSVSAIGEYLLVNSEFTDVITEITYINPEDSTQSKVKESKEDIIVKIQKNFYQSLIPFLDDFGKTTIREFYDYWSEPNKSRTKIRMQLEKTWDAKRRLDRWAKNKFKTPAEEKEEKVIYKPKT